MDSLTRSCFAAIERCCSGAKPVSSSRAPLRELLTRAQAQGLLDALWLTKVSDSRKTLDGLTPMRRAIKLKGWPLAVHVFLEFVRDSGARDFVKSLMAVPKKKRAEVASCVLDRARSSVTAQRVQLSVLTELVRAAPAEWLAQHWRDMASCVVARPNASAVRLFGALVAAGVCERVEQTQPAADTSESQAESDSVAAMRELVSLGFDVRTADRMGRTALMYAAAGKDVPLVKFLLSAGADARATDLKGNSVMDCAAAGGPGVLAALASAGVAVNQADGDGHTPLMRAVLAGKIKRVQALLASDCDLDAGDKHGNTALLHACHARNDDIVLALAEAGARTLGVRNHDGLSVMWLCSPDSGDSLERVRAEGAFYSTNHALGVKLCKWICNGEADKVADLLAKHPGLAMERVAEQPGPLNSALTLDDSAAASMLEVLVQHGAAENINTADYIERGGADCLPPLHFAASRGLVKASEVLLANGARKTSVWKHEDEGVECTALGRAVCGGHNQLIPLLLEPDDPKSVGYAAREAAWRGNLEALRALADTPAFNDVVNAAPVADIHIPLLSFATLEAEGEIVDELLRLGADASALDEDGGGTPLHRARDGPIAKTLIENGAEVDARNSDGMTPLLHAITSEYPDEIVLVLLEAGADPIAPDKDGNTPLQVAREMDHALTASLASKVHGMTPELREVLEHCSPNLLDVTRLFKAGRPGFMSKSALCKLAIEAIACDYAPLFDKVMNTAAEFGKARRTALATRALKSAILMRSQAFVQRCLDSGAVLVSLKSQEDVEDEDDESDEDNEDEDDDHYDLRGWLYDPTDDEAEDDSFFDYDSRGPLDSSSDDGSADGSDVEHGFRNARISRYRPGDVESVEDSPLQLCVSTGNVECLKILLAHAEERGQLPLVGSIEEPRPIMRTAARTGQLDVIQALLDVGVEPTHYAMRVAVRQGQASIVSALLEAGLQPRNGELKTAMNMHRDDMAVSLVRAGADLDSVKGTMWSRPRRERLRRLALSE